MKQSSITFNGLSFFTVDVKEEKKRREIEKGKAWDRTPFKWFSLFSVMGIIAYLPLTQAFA